MKLFAKIIAGFILFCLVVTVSAWILRFQLATLMLEPQLGPATARYLEGNPEPAILKHLEQMKKDTILLSKYPLFNRSSQGKKDAAPFLNPLMTWNNEDQDVGPLKLSPAVIKALSGSRQS